MEENDVKSTCGGTRLDYKMKKYDKFQIKVWHVVKIF